MREEKSFDDYNTDTLDYEFCGPQQRTQRDVSMYTEEFQQQSTSTTTAKQTRTIKFQVESEQINTAYKLGEVEPLTEHDSIKLSLFLRRILPDVMASLDESAQLKLFQDYVPLSGGGRKETTELYCLANAAQRSLEVERGLEITDIQWNSNGLLLAASCADKSFICAWNLAKRDFSPDRATYQLETLGCVMSLSFHPSKPNLLAAGYFTGQIMIYDITSGEAEKCASEMDEYFHRESITQLQWIDTKVAGLINNSLLSLGTDGKLLLWPINFESLSLQHPLKGHHLLRKKESQVEGVGGTCFAQCQEDASNFIIGSEGGSVLRGLVNPISYDRKGHAILELREHGVTWREEALIFMGNMNQKFIPEVKGLVDEYCSRRGITDVLIKHIILAKPDIRKLYINPISFAYEAHYGTVFGIASSPFLKSLFVTCSMDGQIRLYDLLNARSLMTFEYFSQYILSVQFSPQRPCVLAATNSSGEILMFDLKHSHKKETLVLKPASVQSSQSATNVRFNSRQSDLLACSYSGCQVRVYQLSDQFAHYQDAEEIHLAKLLDEVV